MRPVNLLICQEVLLSPGRLGGLLIHLGGGGGVVSLQVLLQHLPTLGTERGRYYLFIVL